MHVSTQRGPSRVSGRQKLAQGVAKMRRGVAGDVFACEGWSVKGKDSACVQQLERERGPCLLGRKNFIWCLIDLLLYLYLFGALFGVLLLTWGIRAGRETSMTFFQRQPVPNSWNDALFYLGEKEKTTTLI